MSQEIKNKIVAKYLITTRPAAKFFNKNTKCINILNIPLTETVAEEENDKIISYLKEDKPDIIVLTSSVGASLFFKYYYKFDPAALFIAIGKYTAKKVLEYTNNVVSPDEADSYGVIEILKKFKNQSIALFRSNEANDIITSFLKDKNFVFKEFTIYTIKKIYNKDLRPAIFNERCIGILITSSMEALIFNELAGKVDNIKIYSIGSVTTDTLKKLGYEVFMTGNSDFNGMLEKIDMENC